MREVKDPSASDMRRHGLFEAYQDELNQKALGMIIAVAAAFELLQIYMGDYLARAGFFYSETNLEINMMSVVTLLFYIGTYLIIQYRYDAFPDVISIATIGFVVGHQMQTFFATPGVWLSLIFWSVLVLMISWQYIGPGLSLPLIVASYAWFIFGLYFYNVPINNYIPFVWVLFLVLVLCVFFALSSNRKARETFNYNNSLKEDYAAYDKRLNFDVLTGLNSNFALEKFIKSFEYKPEMGNIHVILFDLDHMKVCNSVYGRDSGDVYLQTFAKIIRFLVKDSDDIIARTSGDKFTAILSSYRSTTELEKRLERYNHLLRDEFDKGHNDRKFMAWFSYGIVESNGLEDFQELLTDAEKRLYRVKEKNKRYLMTRSHLMADINYLSLFSDSNITVIVWLPLDGWPIGFVTENIKDMLGYSAEEFITTSDRYADYVHPADAGRVFDEIARYLEQQQEHYEQIYRIRKKDGTYIWIRDYSVPVWREGVLAQINGYMYDITLEIEAKNLLEEQEQLFRDIIDATNMGTWQWHMLKDEFVINERYAEMFGYTKAELSPLSMRRYGELVHPDDWPRLDEMLQQHLRGTTSSYQMERRVRHKNGSWVWILDRGNVMKWTEDGRPEIMVGAQTDITELKVTEARLRQSEKLNAIGRMAGGIAHDMNNLLMMMSGYIGLAQEKDDLLAYRDSMPVVDGLVSKASDTVKQIMAFTKHHIYDPKVIDLRNVLQEMAEMIDRTFEKNIRMILRCPETAMMIRGDQALIENALLNLCLNARDAMDLGGELILSLEAVHVTDKIKTLTGQLPVGDYARIVVKDNGSGIDEAHIEKIFEPFFTTKEFGGGIGLAMVVSVVKEHGGDLAVTTEKGLGTEFALYFPVVSTDDQVVKAPVQLEVHKDVPEGTVESKPLRVMIVDDEPVISEVLTEFLEEKGCKPMAFTDPRDAIRYYNKHSDKVDAVLLDMLMPEMTGTEVFDKLLEVNPDVRVLYLSGYSEGLEISDTIRNNVLGFLKKPVKLKEVYQQLIQIKK